MATVLQRTKIMNLDSFFCRLAHSRCKPPDRADGCRPPPPPHLPAYTCLPPDRSPDRPTGPPARCPSGRRSHCGSCAVSVFSADSLRWRSLDAPGSGHADDRADYRPVSDMHIGGFATRPSPARWSQWPTLRAAWCTAGALPEPGRRLWRPSITDRRSSAWIRDDGCC